MSRKPRSFNNIPILALLGIALSGCVTAQPTLPICPPPPAETMVPPGRLDQIPETGTARDVFDALASDAVKFAEETEKLRTLQDWGRVQCKWGDQLPPD